MMHPYQKAPWQREMLPEPGRVFSPSWKVMGMEKCTRTWKALQRRVQFKKPIFQRGKVDFAHCSSFSQAPGSSTNHAKRREGASDSQKLLQVDRSDKAKQHNDLTFAAAQNKRNLYTEGQNGTCNGKSNQQKYAEGGGGPLYITAILSLAFLAYILLLARRT